MGLVARHFLSDESIILARRLFTLAFLSMYLKFFEVFFLCKDIGVKIIMIKAMLNDLCVFLVIAVLLMFGVGVYYHANLWPDHQSMWSGGWTNWRIWTILYYPYWQLFGEINLGVLDGSEQDDCINDTTILTDSSMELCPQKDWTVPLITGFYLLFSNLLLVNLVIAMFSYTFERVQENSEKLWHYEMYTLLSAYTWRIPSPINLVIRPILCFSIKRECFKNDVTGSEKLEEEKEIKAFQRHFQKIIAHRNHNEIK